MRAVLLILCLSFSYTSLTAQTWRDVQGTFRRYKPKKGGGHVVQTLTLTGTSSGRYTLSRDSADVPGFASGYWIRTKIWQRRRDSLQVVILNYENEFNAEYLEIERSGCLTPVTEYGDRRKRANSFAPVKRPRYEQ